MRLKLEAARLALLKRNQDIYQQSIHNVQTWADKYLAHTQEYQDFSQSLKSLAGVNINPKVPALDKALKMLRQQRVITLSSNEKRLP